MSDKTYYSERVLTIKNLRFGEKHIDFWFIEDGFWTDTDCIKYCCRNHEFWNALNAEGVDDSAGVIGMKTLWKFWSSGLGNTGWDFYGFIPNKTDL